MEQMDTWIDKQTNKHSDSNSTPDLFLAICNRVVELFSEFVYIRFLLQNKHQQIVVLLTTNKLKINS